MTSAKHHHQKPMSNPSGCPELPFPISRSTTHKSAVKLSKEHLPDRPALSPTWQQLFDSGRQPAHAWKSISNLLTPSRLFDHAVDRKESIQFDHECPRTFEQSLVQVSKHTMRRFFRSQRLKELTCAGRTGCTAGTGATSGSRG